MKTKSINIKTGVDKHGILELKSVAADELGPPLYRADLLKQAKHKRGASYEQLADFTGLAKNTVRDAIEGRASKLDPLFILAKYFDVPWLRLFDVDDELSFDPDGRPAGVKI